MYTRLSSSPYKERDLKLLSYVIFDSVGGSLGNLLDLVGTFKHPQILYVPHVVAVSRVREDRLSKPIMGNQVQTINTGESNFKCKQTPKIQGEFKQNLDLEEW